MLRAGFHSTSLEVVACTNKEPSLLNNGAKICMTLFKNILFLYLPGHSEIPKLLWTRPKNDTSPIYNFAFWPKEGPDNWFLTSPLEKKVFFVFQNESKQNLLHSKSAEKFHMDRLETFFCLSSKWSLKRSCEKG